MAWPGDFERIPVKDDWALGPIDDFALAYDMVKHHGWYSNLDPTLAELCSVVSDGDIVVDYSSGTGIVVERFFERNPQADVRFVLVDASPKFLRFALEKLGRDERTAFRCLHFLKEEKRLQVLLEVLPQPLLTRGVDVLCAANAIHLYYNLDDTLRSWQQVLKPGGTVLIQSGNIGNPNAPEDSWIIEDTVERLQPVAKELVRSDPAYAAFQPMLDDQARMADHDRLREKFFLPVRFLSFYIDSLQKTEFEIVDVYQRAIDCDVSQWSDFLSAYHEGILSWAGGSKRVEGQDPPDETVTLRKQLLRESMARLFNHQPSFQACWTYIRARKRAT